VAVDIAPVHSIAARVMAGVGEPALVIPPGASPHGYALRPSEAAALEAADLVVWVGPDLSPWLAEPIAALAPDATTLALVGAEGVALLPVRSGGPFDPHVHAGEDHDHGHEEAAAEPDHDHDHDHATDAEAHDHDHAEGGPDAHIWLDPMNGVAIAGAIAEALSALDPANADAYAANAEAFAGEMEALTAELGGELAPLQGQGFFVFHDAYQYFENRFGVTAAGSIALSDAEAPRAPRIAEIRDRIAAEDIVCVFSEPQFEPKIVATVIEGSGARTGVLDPIGAALEPGAELYPALLRGLADGLADCLGPDA
jgi:zinc transport system substrate-binding protein